MASDLLRFDKSSGKLYLKGPDGQQQIVTPPQTTSRTVFVLVDASGSMAFGKFDSAAKGALDFGLVCISKKYQVGVIVFSDKAAASSPTDDERAFRTKIDKLKCTSGGTFLASALSHTVDYSPAYVLVVTDGEVSDSRQSLEVPPNSAHVIITMSEPQRLDRPRNKMHPRKAEAHRSHWTDCYF